MNKEQEFIIFWSDRIPELKNKFEKELKVMNDNEYYQNENNRVYHLMSCPFTAYFDEALANQDLNKLELFFKTFDEYYNIFKGQFVTNDNIPNDLIIDILYTYIFEGIGEDDKQIAIKSMPISINQMYQEWLQSF